ncbi:MAG: hypothetical protein WBB05_29300 [Mycolicibacterium fortuitum]|uniref:hypothetical protein n=1 Tax=Mycolicibacterium fortuitum TaxID=1766 RepID=UPI0022BA1F5B|nr:hypothetical protein [Mycolicibacterium fortuitum]WAY19774.1 hypothetical protein OF855_01155 [Mycolicibacterium fortuitum]
MTSTIRAVLAGRVPIANPEAVQRLCYTPAIAGLFAFVWFELAFPHADSPSAVAAFLIVYAVVNVSGGVLYGPGWHSRCDAFEVYFALVARLSPVGRRDDGRLVIRNPLNGLLTAANDTGLAVMILVALGSTAFDGLTRLPLWTDIWGGLGPVAGTLLATAALMLTIAVVSAGYVGAIRATRPYSCEQSRVRLSAAFAHSLIPIMVGYTIAHYFSFAVFQGQAGYLLAGDPLARSWRLFGSTEGAINYTVVSTGVIAAVQIGAIVSGHVLSVVSAHDQAIAVLRPGYIKVGQYPMLALMVAYTVAGIYLVSGG